LQSLARNDALAEGNKRLALAATIAFLSMNAIRLTLNKQSGARLARCRDRFARRRCQDRKRARVALGATLAVGRGAVSTRTPHRGGGLAGRDIRTLHVSRLEPAGALVFTTGTAAHERDQRSLSVLGKRTRSREEGCGALPE
jgi:hypothetical protein